MNDRADCQLATKYNMIEGSLATSHQASGLGRLLPGRSRGRALAPVRRPIQLVAALAILTAALFVLALWRSPEPAAAQTVVPPATVIQWELYEAQLTASAEIPWNSFPVQAVFTHSGGTQITIDGYYDGLTDWKIRFAPPLAGSWTWVSTSTDPGLDNASGSVMALTPTEADKQLNANYRGHLSIAGNNRTLERADGTPFLLLADTAWWMNSRRCPLEPRTDTGDKSCNDYIENRAGLGFNTLLLSLFDIHDRNEEGYPFPCNTVEGGNGDYSCLNEIHFQSLDQRIAKVWAEGLAIYAHPSWLVGHLPNEQTTPAQAMELARYTMARYGWTSMIFSLSGEYQYGYDANGAIWLPSDWNAYGDFVQANNPYDHLITTHTSSDSTKWENLHVGAGRQSTSGQFHNESWLDINSVQSGHGSTKLNRVPDRIQTDYSLTPAKPVLHVEGWYGMDHREAGPTDAQLRWQAYGSILSGSLGHGAGYHGVWNFYNYLDGPLSIPDVLPNGFTGPAWWITMYEPSARELGRVPEFFEDQVGNWQDLEPRRSWLSTSSNDYENGAADPFLAATPDLSTLVAYFPDLHGQAASTFASNTTLANKSWQAIWYNPADGSTLAAGSITASSTGQLTFPSRPGPEYWLLTATLQSTNVIINENEPTASGNNYVEFPDNATSGQPPTYFDPTVLAPVLPGPCSETNIISVGPQNLATRLQNLSAGDTLELQPGNYTITSNLSVTGQGTQADPICVRSRDGLGTVTINAGGPLNFTTAQWWRIEGLRFVSKYIKVDAPAGQTNDFHMEFVDKLSHLLRDPLV